jgi:hypothetical protein
MPNTNGDTNVIAAIITAGATAIGAIIGLVLTRFFTLRQSEIDREAAFEERYFYEAYHNRIAIYNDVITVLSNMISGDKLSSDIDSDLFREIDGCFHDIEFLLNRLTLFGSPNSIKIISSLLSNIRDIRQNKKIDVRSVIYIPSIRLVFIDMVKDALSHFSEIIRVETGTHIVDKFILKFRNNANPFGEFDRKYARQHDKKPKKRHPDE